MRKILALLLGGIGVCVQPIYAQTTDPVTSQKIVPSAGVVVNFNDLARSVVPFVGAPSFVTPPVHRKPAEPITPYAPPTYTYSRPLAVSPSPVSNFSALPDAAAVGSGSFSIPPDTHGAIGLTKIMVTLNNNVAIQDKATGATLSTVSLNTFFAPAGATGLFDPKVLYDRINDRWIFVATSDASVNTNSSICIGVSQTSDPSGSWYLTKQTVGTATTWADFPCVGFNKNWIAVSVNMFNSTTGASVEGRMVVLNYPLARTGTFSGQLYTGGGFCWAPAVTHSPYQDTLFVVGHQSSAGGTYAVHRFTGTAAASVFGAGTTTSNGLGGWTQPGNDILPQAPQPAPGTGTAKLNAVDAYTRTSVIYRDGYLFFAQAVGLPAGGPISRTAVQWTKTYTSGAFIEGGRIDDPTATATNGGKWYSYPSLDVNLFGDILLGFSQFSSAQWPSAGYAFKPRSESVMRDPIVFKAGEDYYYKVFSSTRNRWGDYSNTQFDPSDNYSLWTIQEYSMPQVGTGSNSSRWGTWWAKMQPTDAPGTLFQSKAASGTWAAAASWETSPGTATWSAAGAAPTSASYGISVLSGHTITIAANAAADQVVVHSGGKIVVNSGQTLTLDNGPEFDLVNFGTVEVNGTLSTPGTLYGTGTYSGTGTIAMSTFSNSGVVAPGNSPGILTISGNYAQPATGALNVELGGTTVGTQYDRLNITGTATLSGALNVSLFGGYNPSIGSSFLLLDAASLTGNFTSVNLPAPYAGTVSYDNAAGTVTLTITGILPVNLVSFTGNLLNKDVALNWQVSEEVNHDRYEVERSFDGRFYTPVATRMAQAGTGNKSYHVTDANIVGNATNGNLYYRLKIISTSGEVSYSRVVMIGLKNTGNFVLNAQPNPFNNYFSLYLNLPKSGIVSVRLMDAAGRVVLSQRTTIQKGFSTIVLGELNVLQQGSYVLHVEYNGQRNTQKLIKAN